jgi:hypothetical protein
MKCSEVGEVVWSAWSGVKWVKWSENCWFTKCLTFPFVVVFVVAGCIVFVLAVVESFIVVLCFALMCFECV